MSSYSVIVFLGILEGTLVKPCLEQSTMAPSLAQWHLSGQVESAQTVDKFSPTRTEIDTIITQDFILNYYSWSCCIYFHENMARMKKISTHTAAGNFNFFFKYSLWFHEIFIFPKEFHLFTLRMRRTNWEEILLARRNGAPWPPLSSASLASQLPVLFVVPLLLNYELSNCSHHQHCTVGHFGLKTVK